MDGHRPMESCSFMSGSWCPGVWQNGHPHLKLVFFLPVPTTVSYYVFEVVKFVVLYYGYKELIILDFWIGEGFSYMLKTMASAHIHTESL